MGPPNNQYQMPPLASSPFESPLKGDHNMGVLRVSLLRLKVFHKDSYVRLDYFFTP
jgi:hypothetical protein